MEERVASMVISFNLADLDPEQDLLIWGSRLTCMEEFRLENPVDAKSLFLRGYS